MSHQIKLTEDQTRSRMQNVSRIARAHNLPGTAAMEALLEAFASGVQAARDFPDVVNVPESISHCIICVNQARLNAAASIMAGLCAQSPIESLLADTRRSQLAGLAFELADALLAHAELLEKEG